MMLVMPEKVEDPELVVAKYNVVKVRFHRKLCMVFTCINLLVAATIYREEVALFHLSLALNVVAYVAYQFCLRVMEEIIYRPIAKREIAEMDSCDSSLAFDMKDIVIIINAAQLLSCVSLYCWGLMLTIYIKIIMMMASHFTKAEPNDGKEEERNDGLVRIAKICTCPLKNNPVLLTEEDEVYLGKMELIVDEPPKEPGQCEVHGRIYNEPRIVCCGCNVPVPEV